MEETQVFYELSDDTIEMIEEILDSMAIPFKLRIKYQGNAKMKKLIDLSKLSDAMVHITNYDLIIFINEDYLINLEDENATILIHQELDRMQFDVEKGKFKLTKFPLQTTEGVLMKYGIDAVARANQLSELYTEQKKDKNKDTESEFDVKDVPTRSIKKVDFLSDDD